MRAAVVRYDLHVPQSRSLKAKRAAIKPLLEGARHRFAVSIAEVGYQERAQRSEIAFAAVASSSRQLDALLDSVDRFVWSHPEVEVLESERSELPHE